MIKSAKFCHARSELASACLSHNFIENNEKKWQIQWSFDGVISISYYAMDQTRLELESQLLDHRMIWSDFSPNNSRSWVKKMFQFCKLCAIKSSLRYVRWGDADESGNAPQSKNKREKSPCFS